MYVQVSWGIVPRRRQLNRPPVAPNATFKAPVLVK